MRHPAASSGNVATQFWAGPIDYADHLTQKPATAKTSPPVTGIFHVAALPVWLRSELHDVRLFESASEQVDTKVGASVEVSGGRSEHWPKAGEEVVQLYITPALGQRFAAGA